VCVRYAAATSRFIPGKCEYLCAQHAEFASRAVAICPDGVSRFAATALFPRAAKPFHQRRVLHPDKVQRATRGATRRHQFYYKLGAPVATH
jgi:outer membrane protein assembly factor BamE (lipoprotein component of BamABCDE complex)